MIPEKQASLPRSGDGRASSPWAWPPCHGTPVSDFWGASLSPKHAFCNAHILRELTAIAELDRHIWASDIASFLLDLKEGRSCQQQAVRGKG